ncbi:MAG TPA: CHAT domain-containing protein, partial [Bryobacteraceae bacterium]|nr:CHAT domain-containing protein [Bryobacteraceae bacterium]
MKAELLVAGETPERALEVLDSPAEIARPDKPEFEAGYLYVRGYALSQLGQYSNARPLLEQARAVAAGARLASLESTVLVRLGTVLFFLGDRVKAEESYRSALAKADAAGDPYLKARAQEALGFLYLKDSRYDECATWSARALHTYEAMGAELRTASVSDNLGWCDYRLGEDDAQALFARAQQLFTKHRRWGALGINLNVNGAAAVARGDLPAARSYYERVIDLATKTGDPQTLADGRTNLATTLILLGDIAAAEAINTQAQDTAGDRVEFETRLRMKLNSGRIEAARGKLARAEAICRSVAESGIRQPRLLIDATLLLAKLLDREGRPRDSEKALQRALVYLDDSRAELLRDESKLTYSAALIQTFRDYVDLLCRQNRPLDALEIAESSRGRLLAERSNAGKAPSTPAALRELARRTGAVFLFYWIAPGRSHLWAIASTGIVHVALPADTNIQPLVDSYRRFIEGYGDPLSVANPGLQLFAELIEPVQHLLPPRAHVVIVPDGPLFDINFESLPVQAGRPHYWLQDVIVSVAPSLGALLHSDLSGHLQRPRLLLIGDALSAGQNDFPRLANARTEMERIRIQFPPGASVLRSGADATPDAYAEADPANFSIIHFAAHATANRESPLDSAVVLTPRRGNY